MEETCPNIMKLCEMGSIPRFLGKKYGQVNVTNELKSQLV
jgi:hypothetical protein